MGKRVIFWFIGTKQKYLLTVLRKRTFIVSHIHLEETFDMFGNVDGKNLLLKISCFLFLFV